MNTKYETEYRFSIQKTDEKYNPIVIIEQLVLIEGEWVSHGLVYMDHDYLEYFMNTLKNLDNHPSMFEDSTDAGS
jgi:hypothetical protein